MTKSRALEFLGRGGRRSSPSDRWPTPSILDRLFDEDVSEKSDQTASGVANIFLFKAAIARDLESLLNSRCVDAEEFRRSYPLASSSMLFYGIRDLSSLSLLDPAHQAQLREQIRRSIDRFEPRLGQVRVSMEMRHDLERRLRFRVDAILRVHPARPPVTFDAWLHIASAQYQFSEIA